MAATAQDRRAQRMRERLAEREQEKQQRRDLVIAEFDGDPQAMADAILIYCRALNERRGRPRLGAAGRAVLHARPGTLLEEERRCRTSSVKQSGSGALSAWTT